MLKISQKIENQKEAVVLPLFGLKKTISKNLSQENFKLLLFNQIIQSKFLQLVKDPK